MFCTKSGAVVQYCFAPSDAETPRGTSRCSRTGAAVWPVATKRRLRCLQREARRRAFCTHCGSHGRQANGKRAVKGAAHPQPGQLKPKTVGGPFIQTQELRVFSTFFLTYGVISCYDSGPSRKCCFKTQLYRHVMCDGIRPTAGRRAVKMPRRPYAMMCTMPFRSKCVALGTSRTALVD